MKLLAQWRDTVLRCPVPIVPPPPSLSQQALDALRPVASCVACVIFLGVVTKAVRTWSEKPARRDGRSYGSATELDAIGKDASRDFARQTDVHFATGAAGAPAEPDLAKRHSIAQLVSAEREEELFTQLARLMCLVARLFTAKAVVHGAVTFRATQRDGVLAMPAFFDSTDELAFAFFIRSAAAGFEACARKLREEGRNHDVSSMVEALTRLRELWERMRLPLIIQTLIKVASLVGGLMSEG